MKQSLRRLRAFSVNGRNIIFIFLVLILISGAILAWKDHHSSRKNSNPAKANPAPTLTEQKTAAAKFANDSLQKKDYDSAVQGYIAESNTAFYQKNYQQAKTVLQDCIKNVPDVNVPWYAYSSLATIAKQLNDTALEKTSLQTAIQKASAVDSGVPVATVSSLQKNLDGIK